MSGRRETQYVRLEEIEPLEVSWLIKDLIPKGMLTVAEGDPGIGKSFALMNLSATISSGGALPNGEKVDPSRALFVSAEDPPEYTIRPRIEAMGGDVRNVIVQENYEPFTEDGFRDLCETIEKYAPSLVAIDPFYAFHGDTGDYMKSSVVRPFLTDLAGLAREYQTAVVAVRHLAKAPKGNAIYQGAGAIDVIGVARAGILFARHPEMRDVTVMAQLKTNIAPKTDSYQFSIVPVPNTQMARVKWLGRSTLMADDLVAGASTHAVSERSRATDFLRELLEDGPKIQPVILNKAKKLGISKRTLDRAKKDLKIESRKDTKSWKWSLPKNG